MKKIEANDKQLEETKFVSRATISAILIGLLGGLTKLLFFSDKP